MYYAANLLYAVEVNIAVTLVLVKWYTSLMLRTFSDHEL